MADDHPAPEEAVPEQPGELAPADDATEVLDLFDDDGRPITTGLDQAATEESGPSYTLMVRTGQQAGRSWRVGAGDIQVGRHPYNDIALDHITVSRSHCRISVDDTGLTLTDLGSTNGTYVNGRLVESTTIIPGDELMIGTFRLLLVRGR